MTTQKLIKVAKRLAAKLPSSRASRNHSRRRVKKESQEVEAISLKTICGRKEGCLWGTSMMTAA